MKDISGVSIMKTQKLSDAERATLSQRKALESGYKKVGFFASIETQRKIDELMKRRQVKQKKELLEMLIDEAFQKTA